MAFDLLFESRVARIRSECSEILRAATTLSTLRTHTEDLDMYDLRESAKELRAAAEAIEGLHEILKVTK